MSSFLSDKYKSLVPYTPGEQPQDKKYVKLNTNESPYPPSPLAVELAAAELERSRLYPDPDANALLDTIANTYSVKRENVIVTNGSDEVLNFAFMAYCDAKTPAVFPDITYGFYKVFADINGVPYKEIPLNQDFTVNLNEFKKSNGTVFIANPNAPTGICLSLGEIEELLASNPGRVVVIDEAYVDFGAESAVKLIDKYPNLLVTMTFSKSRSMAGARLGFGIAGRDIISDLTAIKYSTNPYNVNRITAAMGVGALKDVEYFKGNVEKIISVRTDVAARLSELGFKLTPSRANFLFASSEKISGEELYLKLKARGVLVRHFKGERIKNYVRITVGSREEMQILVDKITEILEEIK